MRLVSSVLGNDNNKIKLIDISNLYQKLLSKTDMMRDAVEFVSMQTLEPEPRRHHNKKTSTGQCFICHLFVLCNCNLVHVVDSNRWKVRRMHSNSLSNLSKGRLPKHKRLNLRPHSAPTHRDMGTSMQENYSRVNPSPATLTKID